MTTSGATPAEEALGAVLAALDGVVPGGVAVVTTAEGILFERAFGRRALVPEREDATTGTLWDCASLTKPLVTAACWLHLRQRGFDLALPASALVPELAGGPHRSPTIAELLVHAGGLPAWEPLYALAPGGIAARARWLATHRDEPGRESVYGCPGYQVLGLAIERATGEPLARFAEDLLWPGRSDLHLPVPPRWAELAAPTEIGNVFEKELAGERARGYDGFRTDLIRGETHDHCAFTLGGAAGNAGLFGTGAGIAHLARHFLGVGPLLRDQDLEELSSDLSPPSGGERRTWGFQLATSAGSPAGPALGPRAFGHAGFTGTSVMIDPDRGAAYVLLTNRIHPRHVEHAFHADRRRFHAAAAALVDERIRRRA